MSEVLIDGQPLAVGAAVWCSENQPLRQDAGFVEGTVAGFAESATAALPDVLVELHGSGQVVRVQVPHVSLANARGESGPDDHCGLVHLNEPALLHSTLTRAAALYAWVGSSRLLSVNPCTPARGAAAAASAASALMATFRNRTREVGDAKPSMRGGRGSLRAAAASGRWPYS